MDKIKSLTKYLEQLVEIYIRELGAFIPKDRIDFLTNKQNLSTVIGYGATNDNNSCATGAYCNGNMILYSTNTDELIQRLIIENSDYGRKPDVQLVSGTSFIDNEKDYIDYLNYFILKGLKEIDYYMDVLPHETMHLIGIGGGVIGEGIAERRTRQICKKYNLQCAPILHTKEAKLVGLMERLAGDPVITRAGFASGKERYKELEQTLDNKCSKGFFEQIISNPIIQYQGYLKCRSDNPIRTFNAYRQMDFSNSYRLLEHQIEWDR